MKKIFCVLLCFVMIFNFVPMETSAKAKLNYKTKSIYVGKTVQLKVSGTKKKVTWKSSSNKIATVSSKGKVSGKKKGTATITAKYSKTKLTCKITVKEKKKTTTTTQKVKAPTSNVVIQNTEQDKIDPQKVQAKTYKTYKNDIVIEYTNNNKLPVSVDSKIVFYDDKGSIITTKTNSIDSSCIESGCNYFVSISCPYNSDFEDIEYSDYKLLYDVTKASGSYFGRKNIAYKVTMSGENANVEFNNNSTVAYDYVKFCYVFYDENGNILKCDTKYTKCEGAGSYDVVSIDYPYDKNYNTIAPASCKICVAAYGYDW